MITRPGQNHRDRFSVARNSLGQISSVTTKKDAAAAAVTVATGITYAAMPDLVTGFTYGNGLGYLATYDLDRRIATLRVVNGPSGVISLTYAYGDSLNLTAITDNLSAASNQAFTYSALNRLLTASGPYGAYTFTVDGVGNRTQEQKTVGGTTTTKVLAYPAGNNRLSSETTNGTLSRSFTYDGAGNLLSGLPPGAAYAVDYAKRNRPSALKQSGTVVTSYLYNAQEQLVSRSVAAPLSPVGTTHYIYDLQGHLIAEAFGTTAATAVLTREYIWLDDMPVAVVDGVNTASPVTYAVHADHLMRPIKMTDAAKATVWSAQWLPFGEAFAITGPATQNLRFPGQYFLIEQGLAYNWHRHYDPSTGRYTQPDPLGFPDGPSRYAYVGGSPFMRTDTFGLVSGPFSSKPGYQNDNFCSVGTVVDCEDAYLRCIQARGLRAGSLCSTLRDLCRRGFPGIFAPGVGGRK